MWTRVDSVIYGLGVVAAGSIVLAAIALVAWFVNDSWEQHVKSVQRMRWALSDREDEVKAARLELLEVKTKLERLEPIKNAGYRATIDLTIDPGASERIIGMDHET